MAIFANRCNTGLKHLYVQGDVAGGGRIMIHEQAASHGDIPNKWV
jgi:hypothetical protein